MSIKQKIERLRTLGNAADVARESADILEDIADQLGLLKEADSEEGSGE